MIIIKLKGGPGNQLFQYAFGRLLSIKNKTEVKYKFLINKKDSKREYFLGYFNTKINIPTDIELQKIRYPFGVISKFFELFKKITRQFNIGYIPKLLNIKNGYLEGYWQSYKYLDPIRNDLLNEITLKNPIEGKYEILNKIENTNSVCLNVRRGDYINNPKNIKEYNTFGMEYYENSFKIIKDKIINPTIYVFSDDIAWCINNIKTDIPIVFSDPNIPIHENFVIATKCKHNIIVNSSYSFWVAWLNKNPNKIVIAPKKWNNIHTKEYVDLLPIEWIKI